MEAGLPPGDTRGAPWTPWPGGRWPWERAGTQVEWWPPSLRWRSWGHLPPLVLPPESVFRCTPPPGLCRPGWLLLFPETKRDQLQGGAKGSHAFPQSGCLGRAGRTHGLPVGRSGAAPAPGPGSFGLLPPLGTSGTACPGSLSSRSSTQLAGDQAEATGPCALGPLCAAPPADTAPTVLTAATVLGEHGQVSLQTPPPPPSEHQAPGEEGSPAGGPALGPSGRPVPGTGAHGAVCGPRGT